VVSKKADKATRPPPLVGKILSSANHPFCQLRDTVSGKEAVNVIGRYRHKTTNNTNIVSAGVQFVIIHHVFQCKHRI